MRFSWRHDPIIQADSFFSRPRGGSVVRSTCSDMPSKGSDWKCPQVDMSSGLEGRRFWAIQCKVWSDLGSQCP